MDGQTLDNQHALDDAITVRSIAELSLKTCAPTDNVGTVFGEMEESNIDIFPVGVDGVYSKYVQRSQLANFPKEILISEAACLDIRIVDVLPIHSTLREALHLLVQRSWLFCIEGNGIRGVVTRGDLQRLPARTYFFAVTTAFELQVLDKIRKSYPDDEWQEYPDFPSQILKKARAEMTKRTEAGEGPSALADCLMFSGKLAVLKRTTIWKDSLSSLAMTTLANAADTMEDAIGKLVALRNNVAHGYDLTKDLPRRWDDLLKAVEFMEAATPTLKKSAT